jgi:hypothetical protein
MAIVFDEILTKGVRAGQIPAREQSARNWYRDTARTYKRVNENKLMSGDKDRLTARPLIGQMFMFSYDAKHKSTLPYFDRLPLVFPFKKVKGGFYGINLHYLPLSYRAKLMDSLYDIANNDRYDTTTRINLSYKVLNSAAKYKFFKPCVKHYLTSQLQSRFLYIYPSEWDIALFMPLERFQGASKSTVFAESKRAIG